MIKKSAKEQGIKNPQRLLNYLVKKEMLYKVVNNFYTIKKDEIRACNAFFPFYFSLHTAMSIRNLTFWTQETRTNICTTKRIRKTPIEIYGKNSGYRIFAHHIPQKYLFGYSIVTDSTYGKLLVAEPEKILIDMIYLQIKESKKLYNILINNIDKNRLKKYSKAYNSKMQKEFLIHIIPMKIRWLICIIKNRCRNELKGSAP